MTDPPMTDPQSPLPPSLPPAALDWALFLDFDGTLAPLAPHPDAVAVQPSLVESLEGLGRSLHGAVAVVSGRPVSQIDGFLSPLTLAVAGKHGLETRLPGQELVAQGANPALARVKARLASLVAADPRLLLEDKVQTIALHYRQAPEREAECARLVSEVVKREDGALQVLRGKMVVEVKPVGINKGVAITRLMAVAPFVGRRPVFAGDDVTDEDGFEAVNAMGGLSILIGPAAATAAVHRAPGEAEFVAWLGRVNHTLAALAAQAVQKKGAAS